MLVRVCKRLPVGNDIIHHFPLPVLKITFSAVPINHLFDQIQCDIISLDTGFLPPLLFLYLPGFMVEGLVVGRKYTYEDVFRLLNWNKNAVALNVGGYKYDAETKTYPVFVNYDKPLEINDTIRYEDRFVDPSTLVAISKSKRTLDSADVMTAADSERLGVRMFLFVRKNKDDKESKEFYYLGRIRHEAGGVLKQFVMPNTDVSAVEIEYKLETPVEKNLYDYLTSENV